MILNRNSSNVVRSVHGGYGVGGWPFGGKKDGKTIIMVEQNAKKGLAFADIGYVLVSGETAIAGNGNDLLENPDVGRLFLGG